MVHFEIFEFRNFLVFPVYLTIMIAVYESVACTKWYDFCVYPWDFLNSHFKFCIYLNLYAMKNKIFWY